MQGTAQHHPSPNPLLRPRKLRGYLRRAYARINAFRYPRWLGDVIRTEGLISTDEARLLFELAKNVADGCIVEVGSYRGRSTAALAHGSSKGKGVPIYAIEPHEQFHGYYGGVFGPEDRRAFFKTMIRTKAYKLVRLVNLSSQQVAPNWPHQVSLLWIDGDHTYEGVKRDFDNWSPHLGPNAVVAFDDSVDPKCGPAKLIGELVKSGSFQVCSITGKITCIREMATS